MLKYKVSKEEFDALDEAMQSLYVESGDGYQLGVEGIDDGKELKEALRKEREERAEAKRRLQEHETAAEQRERERLEQQQEWETLSRSERERADKLQAQLEEFSRKDAERQREESARSITGQLSRDSRREQILRREAKQFIHHTPDGIKINGPDGEQWSAEQLSGYLRENFDFLVDGNGSSGGGATGSKSGGAAGKKFSEMTGMERVELRRNNPEEYQRLKSQS